LKEQLHNGVTQNVYVAGFGAGTKTFGWYFAPPPYQQVVSPGVRTVYAFVSMEASCAGEGKFIDLLHSVDWVSRKKEGPAPTPSDTDKMVVSLPAEGDSLKITKLAYDPVLYPNPTVGAAGADIKHPVVTLQLELSQDIEPQHDHHGRGHYAKACARLARTRNGAAG
jgi:hypothetical protein